ncbi:MAG TPA: nucleoside triphosphate pyrophosphohydrolase [Humidesulfovibrio sp.]|uniref:nucleoside triphosphate pyrophosphohydrolase n=1 Tax=Humidesulfovibrio sp. TaxID=2910988 RepID=UPI002D0B2EFD|nr:nucleoside triphosphate pyrophosphohydrolase [Humidesulfovibrio sp.]HWR03026.1 nucleoside triphosphate pyrophosphohydrolase [Humidesulfovibrio sp.]
MSSDSASIAKIQEVIDRLLGPGGCPWDQKQTPKTLCDYVIEEAFELVSAIRADDAAETCEELGDVLFLLLFQATLAKRAGQFSLEDVATQNAAKMIRRHPHVFGDTVVADQEELLRNWERIKRGEKKDSGKEGGPAGTFDSLPEGLPPLLKAYRIHSKAARTGFTWATDEDARAQYEAELKEFEETCETGDAERMEEEYGDLLFTLVELGRRKGIKANAALDRANLKFLARYRRMEELARERGLELLDMGLDDKNRLWDEAKALG